MPDFFANAELLSQATSNIGLARRRDLTFRQDIGLTVEGQRRSLKDLFKGQKTVVFGVPDCGKVCSQQHVPGYLEQADKLRQLGITQILCVAVGDPSATQHWAESAKVDPTKVKVATDANGSWTRYLGVELGQPDQPGARSLRYAAVVDDGVLLKLKVDADPAKVDASSAVSVVNMLQQCN
ncbi:hypothetical protein N2152v2_003762 [Parachlorella kessleri]